MHDTKSDQLLIKSMTILQALLREILFLPGLVFSSWDYFNLNGENTLSYLNKVMLIGNLGNNPEIIKSEEQGSFVRLSLATSKKSRDANNEWVDSVHWHTVYVNNKAGKYIATYGKKGDKVYVSGELITNAWQDGEGKPRYATAVYCNECSIIHAKVAADANAGNRVPAPPVPEHVPSPIGESSLYEIQQLLKDANRAINAK